MGILRLLFWGGVFFLLLRVLRTLAPQLTPPRARDAQPQPPSSAQDDPYVVLGVSRSASREEIHRAYQKRIAQYHPDLVAHLAPEIQRLAERRSKEINAAYAQLKKNPPPAP